MNAVLNKSKLLEKTFSSSLRGRSAIIDTVITSIKNNDLFLTISDYELTLIVDEALTNAMEHGNKWDPDKTISVSISFDKNFLYVSIEDEGEGFDFENFRSECSSGNKLANRGRGLIIIKHFCKPEWSKSGRLIELVINLKKKDTSLTPSRGASLCSV
jgi:serine/threonine-protein kinase RsbW